jgi:hypothetical protein
MELQVDRGVANPESDKLQSSVVRKAKLSPDEVMRLSVGPAAWPADYREYRFHGIDPTGTFWRNRVKSGLPYQVGVPALSCSISTTGNPPK